MNEQTWNGYSEGMRVAAMLKAGWTFKASMELLKAKLWIDVPRWARIRLERVNVA